MHGAIPKHLPLLFRPRGDLSGIARIRAGAPLSRARRRAEPRKRDRTSPVWVGPGKRRPAQGGKGVLSQRIGSGIQGRRTRDEPLGVARRRAPSAEKDGSRSLSEEF